MELLLSMTRLLLNRKMVAVLEVHLLIVSVWSRGQITAYLVHWETQMHVFAVREFCRIRMCSPPVLGSLASGRFTMLSFVQCAYFTVYV